MPEKNDIVNWSAGVDSAAAVTMTAAAGVPGLTASEGGSLGVLDWTDPVGGNQSVNIWADLSGGAFEAGSNWSSYQYLSILYSTTTTAITGGNNYRTGIYLTPTAGTAKQFLVPGTNTTGNTWVPLVISLNYARNMGMNLTALSGLELHETASTVAGGQGYVAFDSLSLTNTAQDKPNSQVASAGGSTSACSAVALTWSAAVQDGDDPIAGYHIYRSTVSATGPWTSRVYVLGAASTSYTDPSVPATGTVYYVILPFSTSTSQFGAGGSFTQMTADSGLPGTQGVNETLINSALAVAIGNPQSACSPTPSPSPTRSPTNTPTPSMTATPTATASATPTSSPTPTWSPTLTATPTATPSFTASPTATPSITGIPPSATASPTPSITVSPAGTLTVTPTISLTLTPAPTVAAPTATLTFTAGPTNTPPPPPTVNPLVPAQLYPNPFHPNHGTGKFHFGNLPAGLRISVYDMIGRLVRILPPTQGDPLRDTWDGTNANGVQVTSGIYFVIIQGNTYRLAVVRD